MTSNSSPTTNLVAPKSKGKRKASYQEYESEEDDLEYDPDHEFNASSASNENDDSEEEGGAFNFESDTNEEDEEEPNLEKLDDHDGKQQKHSKESEKEEDSDDDESLEDEVASLFQEAEENGAYDSVGGLRSGKFLRKGYVPHTKIDVNSSNAGGFSYSRGGIGSSGTIHYTKRPLSESLIDPESGGSNSKNTEKKFKS